MRQIWIFTHFVPRFCFFFTADELLSNKTSYENKPVSTWWLLVNKFSILREIREDFRENSARIADFCESREENVGIFQRLFRVIGDACFIFTSAPRKCWLFRLHWQENVRICTQTPNIPHKNASVESQPSARQDKLARNFFRSNLEIASAGSWPKLP